MTDRVRYAAAANRYAPSRAARRELRGATLVELIMVLAILALTASVAMPRFARSISRQRVDAAARRIAADLTLARRRAEQTSAGQHVVFTAAQGTYRLVSLSDADHPASEYLVRLADYDVTITAVDFGGDAEVIFNGFGLPDTTGSLTIQAGDQQRTVLVGSDGTVTITEPGMLPTISP